MAIRLFVYVIFLTIYLFVMNTTVMAANERYYVINYYRHVELLPVAAIGLHCLILSVCHITKMKKNPVREGVTEA